jgi:tetratricopeptide (TPR) repeat protein
VIAATSLPFVGRAIELSALRRRALDVTGGQGHVVQMVRGPAGVGKTRLIGEVLAELTTPTVWVRCWDDSTPMWPWTNVLEQLGRPVDTTRADGVDRLERFTALLAELRSAGPMVVVLDDLHLADHTTLLFTRFLARARPQPDLLVVVTARSTADVDDGRRTELDDLARDADEWTLGNLATADVIEMLHAGGLDTTDRTLVDAVVALTRGLPLAVERTVRGLSQREDPAGVPDLRTSVERAGRELTAAERRQLAAAATYGPNATVADVCAAAGCTEQAAFETIASARRAGLVADGGPAEIAFTHELVREAVAAWLSPPDRVVVHRTAVERMQGGAANRLPLAAAHASALAGIDPVHTANAIELCLRSAEFHRSVGSLEAAVVACDEAARLAERSGLALSIEQRLARADMALAAGHLTRARQLYRDVAAAAEVSGDVAALADAAAGLGGLWLGEHRTDEAAAAVRGLQRRAHQAVVATDPLRALRLEMRLAAEEAYQTRDLTGLDELLDRVRAAGSPRATAEALSMMIHAELGPKAADERIRLAAELTDAAAATGDAMTSLLAQCWTAVAFEMAGDPRAQRARRALELRCLTIRCAGIQFIVDAMSVGDLISAARFDEAEAAAATCFELGQSVGDADAWNYYAGHLALIRFFQGRHAELASFATEASVSPAMSPSERSLASTAAGFALHAGDPAPAQRIIALHWRAPEESDYQPSTWLTAMLAMARIAAELPDPALGRDIAERLHPYRHLPTSLSLAVADLGPVMWSYALALGAAGDLEAADAAFVDAIERSRLTSHVPSMVMAIGDRAWLHHQLGRHDSARELIDDAIARAERHGMTGWVDTWTSRRDGWLSAEPTRRQVTLARTDDAHWRCTFEGRSIVLADTVGIRHLALLCTTPHTDVAAARMAYYAEPHDAPQPILDDAAIGALRDRVAELRRALDDGPCKRGQVEDELDAVSEQLLVAMGLGVSRKFADAGERARTSVRKAISRAIDKIGVADAAMAGHLAEHVHTGHVCRYSPA